MIPAEQLFNSASLTLLVPSIDVVLPDKTQNFVGDDWLSTLEDATERRKAFYGERASAS